VGKTLTNPVVGEGWPNVQNTKICFRLLGTGLRSYDRRQCFEFLLGDLGVTWLIVILYNIYWYICQLQLGCHPVAVVQYTFTHKQYTERHNTNNT